MPKVLYGNDKPLTGCSRSNNAANAVIGICCYRKTNMVCSGKHI